MDTSSLLEEHRITRVTRDQDRTEILLQDYRDESLALLVVMAPCLYGDGGTRLVAYAVRRGEVDLIPQYVGYWDEQSLVQNTELRRWHGVHSPLFAGINRRIAAALDIRDEMATSDAG